MDYGENEMDGMRSRAPF